jgi:ATP synthase protein I
MSNDSGKDGDAKRGQLSPAEREALKARSSGLGQKLEAAKGRHAPPKDGAAQGTAMAKAMRLSTELIGGIVVGGAIGYFLDKWLGTFPWLFILMFLLGSAAGIMNVVRTASKEKTPPAPSVPDDDEDDDLKPPQNTTTNNSTTKKTS